MSSRAPGLAVEETQGRAGERPCLPQARLLLGAVTLSCTFSGRFGQCNGGQRGGHLGNMVIFFLRWTWLLHRLWPAPEGQDNQSSKETEAPLKLKRAGTRRARGSPGVAVGHLCLWFAGAGLEFVKVGQLFPVVVLVLIGVVMVGTHDLLGPTGVRLLRPRHSEEPEEEEEQVHRCCSTASIHKRKAAAFSKVRQILPREILGKTAFTHR